MIHKINTQSFRHEKLWEFINEGQQELIKELRILDVGCGRGWFLERFFSDGFRNLYGCDFVNKLDFADFNFMQVNLNENPLPYREEEFDMVICSDVLEHLKNPFVCIREIRRVLKKSGTLILTIPNCANILQRVYFLLFGNTKRFNPKPAEMAPHIFMTPSWIFNYFIKDVFEIIRMGGDGFIFKSHVFTFVPPKPLFSYTLFMELKGI